METPTLSEWIASHLEQKPQKGQTVYILTKDNNGLAMRGSSIATVGRKFITITNMYGSKFSAEDMDCGYLLEDTDFGYKSRLYFDKELAQEVLDKDRYTIQFRRTCDRLLDDASALQIKCVLAILNGTIKEHDIMALLCQKGTQHDQ